MIFSKKSKDRGIETLRQPDRNPRCYELTDQEKQSKIADWVSNNVYKNKFYKNNEQFF